ncbi:MAG: PAS domain-containing protein, partial [Ferruginibacter sp.]
ELDRFELSMRADNYFVKSFSVKELLGNGHSQINHFPIRKELALRVGNTFMQTPVAICILKGKRHIVEVANDFYLKIIEKGREFIGKPIFESLPRLKAGGLKDVLDKVMQSGIPFCDKEIKIQIVRDEQRQQGFFNFAYDPIRDQDNVITGIMVIVTEVNGDVRSSKYTEENNAFNFTVLENSPDCVKILDAEGRLQYMNINGQCVMNIDDFKKLKNKYWWELWGEENRQMIKDAVIKAVNGEKTQFQALNPTASGVPKWWDVIVLPWKETGNSGDPKQILSVSRDITEQKEAAGKIEESNKRYHMMLMQSPFAFSVMKGKDMVVTLANDLMKEFWGKGANVEGKTLMAILPEIIDQPFPAMINKVYTTGIPVHANEMLARLEHDGKMEDHYFNIVYQPHLEADETISGVITIAYEVTELVVDRKKMEAQALMVKNLLMSAPGFICILEGPDHVYQLINEKYQQLIGKRKLQGKPILIALPELKGQAFDTMLDKVYTTGETYVGIDVPIMLARDEKLPPELRYFNFSYQPMYDENDKINAILVFGYEVTEQMKAKIAVAESEMHFRQMADLMPAKISNADKDGNVRYFNKSWLDFTGLDFEELSNLGYHKIMHPDELEEFQKRLKKAAETGTDLEMEMRFLNKYGEYIWHLNRASPLKDEDGNIKMWIGVTSEIQRIKDEAERKDNFIKMISHELKTPVTSIKGYTQILLRMLEGAHEIKNPLNIKNSLIRVDKQVSRLTRLITEMLDLTRIDESKLLLQKELFNLNELIIETVEDIRYTITEHPIKIYEDFTCNINGDRDRIGQIIINLISNAIKYSPNNDTIELRICKHAKNEVAVSVKDRGIGIRKKDHKKIFERFYRVEGKEENTFSGFGIGLFIAKSIIERHNGSITIESEKGKGSVFTFILPVAYNN